MHKRVFLDKWKFKKENGDVSIISIPHDAMIHEERINCLNGPKTGFFPGGKYIYERDIEILKEDENKLISLFFEGVYRNATIYLNDEKLCFHAYGYTEFEVDISSKVKIGTNTIRVDVDNSLEPNSRWYSGSGIYRPVYLNIKDKNDIKNVQIKTISINPPTINVSLDNEDAMVEIYDGDELIKSSPKGDIVLENAKLWDDINPNLYRIVIKTNSDEVSFNYGIRELKWSSKTGVLINGREVKFRGSCIHHDNGILGACDYVDASDRRIRILKEQGYNAIRSAHNPCSKSILDACDKYGVYVLDETFDMWYIPKTYHDYARNFFDSYEEEIKAMVNKDYNHPSVIMYSIGNENGEPKDKKGMELVKKQVDLIKGIDSTRIVTIGSNLTLMRFSYYKDKGKYDPNRHIDNIDEITKLDKKGSAGFNFWMRVMPFFMTTVAKMRGCGKLADEISKHVDILGLNYGTPRYEMDIRRDPNKILLGTETFNGQIVKNWNLVKKYHQLTGDFCWTGWDYLGEAEGGCGAFDYKKWPGLPIADGAGAIDLIGNPTPINYYMQIAYGTYNKPYIAVEPIHYQNEKYIRGAWRMNNYLHSWSFEGHENKKAIVEVYTSSYQVKLLLNNKVIGTKKVKNNIAKFKVKYLPGELRAIALDKNNNPLGEDVLVSSSKNTQITVSIDKEVLSSNSLELCHVNIDITDEKGIIKPTREDEISLEIEGNSVSLEGFGTARTKIEGNYNTTKTPAHFGRALAIFKPTSIVGETKIIISIKGLDKKEIKLLVK